MGWFSSTPPMHWFGIQTVPLLFPAVLMGLPEREMKTKRAMTRFCKHISNAE